MEKKPKIDLKDLANKAGKATLDAAQSVSKSAVSVAGKTKELTEKSQQAILGAIDQNGNGEVDIEDVIIMGLKVPGIRIDRAQFLQAEFKTKLPQDVIDDAIAFNPLHANIPSELIEKIADEVIKYERNCVSGISAALGMPGGIAMAATIPADIAQYYGYMLRATQKLMYLYGFPAIDLDEKDQTFDSETMNTLIICLGVMYGVAGANLELIYQYLHTNLYVLQAGFKGAGLQHISKDYILDIEIDLPNEEMQTNITKQFRQIDDMICYRNQQLLKYDELVKSRFIELFGDPISNPKGLPVKTLKQLSTLITNGNTPKGGSENYVDDGILFIRSQNVWRNRIELDDVAYIDEETHRSLKKSSLKHKDILITKTGRINTENSSLGRAALFLGKDDSANINGHVYLVRLDGSVVPEYVISILTSEAYRKYIRKVCVGGIDKRQINLDQVEEFPIILPSVKQQNEFATFVEHTDKLKFEVKEALEKLEILKKSLMQQYFG